MSKIVELYQPHFKRGERNMEKIGVILLGFLPNPRFENRIRVERELFDLHVLCWDRCKNMMPQPRAEGYRLHCIPISAENDPMKRLLPYGRFCHAAKRLLREIQPDMIHVQGLDMLRIACQIKRESQKPVAVIYEVADLHRLLVDRQRGLRRFAQFLLKKEDIRCSAQASLVILTSERYYDTYFNAFTPKSKVLYLPNIPDLSAFAAYQKKDPSRDFTVGFIGGVRYKTQMRHLIEAARQCRMRLLIAGFETEPAEIEPLCKAYDRGTWVGRFDYAQDAAALYGKCDVMYAVYDAGMANVRVALPNKLYEAIYCEMPLIVAKGTYLQQVVESWGVGIAVDHTNAGELAAVLSRLRDDTALYARICANCRQQKQLLHPERNAQALQHRLTELCSL